MADLQTLRLRRPGAKKAATQPERHTGVLQDQLRRTARRPWSPSFSLAVRILLLVRVSGAMYSNIQDCDEVFNFWEPLHFLDRGHGGFQTWEVSPVYAIRSWAYILLHLLPAKLIAVLLGPDKRPVFFGVRIYLAVISTFCEVKFYRTVLEKINERVGRYLFFMLLTNAGMWHSSTAFLPSSFAMYTTTFAYSYALEPSSMKNNGRTPFATLLFATGAIVGWPFSLALAIPFVFEELFVVSADRVTSQTRISWAFSRWRRLFAAGSIASLIFIPVIGIDTLAYGRLSFVPWNIVRYNIFGDSARGPDLYGTEPWNFYLFNLVLNFNILVALALISLPALAVTYFVDRKRLGIPKPSPDQSSPFTVLALRLAPVYIWLGILTSQAHKEERFMYPAYPMMCFNAAVSVYLMRGWIEAAFVSLTKSPYRASRSSIFRTFSSSIILGSAILSLSRILALWKYYHAPMTAYYAFETFELPRLLYSTGILTPVPSQTSVDDLPRIDLTPIKQFELTLCLGKEWYRFPGHYLVPDGVRVDFVKSEFEGLLPGHFGEGSRRLMAEVGVGARWWMREETRNIPEGLNDLNQEEPSHYVNIDTCDYLVDLDFPLHPIFTDLEPRYAIDDEIWERVSCTPFLDARHSPLLTRTLWMPGEAWQRLNEFGDYCLLRNRHLVDGKVKRVMERSIK